MFSSWMIFLSRGNYSKLFNLTEYYLYIYIYSIIIIIIMSHHQHGSPWPSPATPLYLSIASGMSSRLNSLSAQSCCMYVLVGCPAFAYPREGVHRSTSLMNSSLLLQQSPACLVLLILIVFVIGSKWPYSCCFVGCSLQDLFYIAGNILV